MNEIGRKALLVVTDHLRRGVTPAPHIAALEAGGMTLIQRDCHSLDRLAELITSMRREVDCVILAGGDGMMSAGAIALRDAGLPLGILPMGAAALGADNELARRLGVPDDAVGAARVILDGHIRPLRLGSVNGRPFFSNASVGLSIEDSRWLHQVAQSRPGGLAYAWAALKIALRTRRFSCIIRCGGVVHRVRTLQVTVGNGRLYAGGMGPQPGLAADDSLLDIGSLERESRWDLVFMSEVFAADDPASLPVVRTARCEVVEVVTRQPMPICADGEIVTVTPARFSILPGTVAVYASAQQEP
jgi:diacylglycerol kinase (ATP)